ncbi:hypothetical protein [Exiguobacterium artemiae]|uniref:hypothetical protein n=1 Tax=Exiguobacterium artemiae TaxID=340145 RepID=UPI003CFFA8AC
MKKLLLFVVLLTGTIVLNGCTTMTSTKISDDRPVIHFDATSIVSLGRDHQVKMLMLSSIPTDSVAVSNANDELHVMKADNNMHLEEMAILQHDEPAAEEFKTLVIDYLEVENAYIDKKIESLYSDNVRHPSRFSMETLYSRADAELPNFRYEPN